MMPRRNPQSLKGLNGIGQKKTKKSKLYKTRQTREKHGQKLTQAMKRKKRQRHRDRFDTIFSKFIRLRDGKCFTCGSKISLQNGHFIKRGVRKYRRDEENCHGQCMRCNVMLHGNYVIYTKRMIEKYGKEKIFHMIEESHKVGEKPSIERLQEKISYYETRVKEM